MSPLLLVGGGGHCRSCIDVIETEGRFRITGVVRPSAEGAEPVMGYAILGEDDDIPSLLRGCPNVLITVGQIRSPKPRIRLFDLVKQQGASLPVIVSPRAIVSRHALVSEGTIVMHGASVGPLARVGANVILNSHALIEHDAVIEPHCHVSTGARVNGSAVVGTGSFIGSGAILREGVHIGSRSIIGAGCVVLRDVPPDTILRRQL